MNENVTKDVLAVLNDTVNAIKQERYFELHGISDHLIHSMSVFQEKDTANVSIVIYSLSKIFEKEKYSEHDFMKNFESDVITHLTNARNSLKSNDVQTFRSSLNKLITLVNNFDNKVKLFEKPILFHAKLQKASKLVAHGLSANQAANYLQVPVWDLNNYIGGTTTHEVHSAQPVDNKERVAFVKRLFGI